MKTLGRLLILALFLPLVAFSADVSPMMGDAQALKFEHVIWDRVPIAIELPIDGERIISFPSPVSVHNIDARLTPDKISILNNNGTLYITAKKAFSAIRISVQLQSGTVVLIDLSGKKNADDRAVSVLLKSDDHQTASSKAHGSQRGIHYAALMRYAVQHLYAPSRLIATSPDISRFPMRASQSVKLLKRSSTIAMPLASWSSKGLYVTAVLVDNVSNSSQAISPSMLNGRWLAFSAYPVNQLSPRGSQYDRTTLFLLSEQPFNKALTSMRGF
jgi:integrating conjugative element protein (TIGR03749 family)